MHGYDTRNLAVALLKSKRKLGYLIVDLAQGNLERPKAASLRSIAQTPRSFEIDIETDYVSMEGMSLVMGELRRALENETIQNTFNIFKSHYVTSVKTDEGYKMKLKPKSAELVKRLGYTVVYATISSDFRIMKLRAKDDAGGEAGGAAQAM